MRALVQRTLHARVDVDDRTIGRIEMGLAVLLGVHASDDSPDAHWIAHRLPHLRVFPDDQGRMNRSVMQILETRGVASGVGILLVPNFTLCASTARGHRPGFDQAMPPERARALFDEVVSGVAALGVPVATGLFGAHMRVTLTNDGPVTLLLDSAEHRPR